MFLFFSKRDQNTLINSVVKIATVNVSIKYKINMLEIRKRSEKAKTTNVITRCLAEKGQIKLQC